MPTEPLSELCSQMAHPGRKTLPADCPEGAAYIKTNDAGSDHVIPGELGYPVVFEGGEGDDKVTVVGSGGKPVMVSGGKGEDALLVVDRQTWLLDSLGPAGTLFLGAAAIVFAAIAIIAWRWLPKPP